MAPGEERTLAVGNVGGAGPLPVTFSERGRGRPLLLLHGGGGPQAVAGLAELVAHALEVRVITPTHPGFAGTPRPEVIGTVRDVAALYAGLAQELGLRDTIVAGNSIGGWVAAELALLSADRVSSLVLIDAVGTDVPGHPVADLFSLTPDQVAELTYHDPAPFRANPAAMSPAQQAVAASNRAALAVYAGRTFSDPTLVGRLAGLRVPTLVLWGSSDRVAPREVGRAYAAAIPGAHFQVLASTGHAPQIETPGLVLQAIVDFIGPQGAA